MAGNFGFGGGGYSFFDEKFDDKNSTQITASERTWMLKNGSNTFWGSRMNGIVPTPGLLKGMQGQKSYSAQLQSKPYSKRKADLVAMERQRPPTERLFPAIETHCKAGDVAAITAIVHKAALAGHPLDLEFNGAVRLRLHPSSQSSRPLALLFSLHPRLFLIFTLAFFFCFCLLRASQLQPRQSAETGLWQPWLLRC